MSGKKYIFETIKNINYKDVEDEFHKSIDDTKEICAKYFNGKNINHIAQIILSIIGTLISNLNDEKLRKEVSKMILSGVMAVIEDINGIEGDGNV
jgi:hypothetical protein